MVTLTLGEVRERLNELVEAASRGETVIIVKDGTPIAELRPARPEPGIDQAAVDEALGDLDQLQDDPARPRVTIEEILSWRDWEALEKVWERNADAEPGDVLDDVTAYVELVREKLYDERGER